MREKTQSKLQLSCNQVAIKLQLSCNLAAQRFANADFSAFFKLHASCKLVPS
nr:MAG TPA: hypothetical protein [Caudoviricetes sp.]